MNFTLRQGEQFIREGRASLNKDFETVGGKLYMTDQRLRFEPNYFNTNIKVLEEELTNIHSLRKCWSKILGFIPILPNSLAVYTKQGKEYSFLLFGRDKWAMDLENHIIKDAKTDSSIIGERSSFIESFFAFILAIVALGLTIGILGLIIWIFSVGGLIDSLSKDIPNLNLRKALSGGVISVLCFLFSYVTRWVESELATKVLIFFGILTGGYGIYHLILWIF